MGNSSDTGTAIEIPVRYVEHQGPPLTTTEPLHLYPNIEMRATGSGVASGAVLRGTTNSFTLNTSPHVLQNYTAAHAAGPFEGNVDPVAGTITVPDDGIHTIIASVYGRQGNNAKEEDIWLYANVAGEIINYDHMVGKVHVATDKSNERYITGVYTIFDEPGNVYSLGMLASAGMGTFTMIRANFEMT